MFVVQTFPEPPPERHEIRLVTRSESRPGDEAMVLLQVFLPENKVEDVLLGLQRSGVGLIAGTGFSLIPTAGT